MDGRTEFAAEFEEACQQREVRLFVLLPAIAETERPHGALAPHPQRRVRPGAGGVRRGARFEPPAATLGENLQLCEATPVSGLPQPVGIREAMETIRPKSKVSLIYWTRTPLFL